MNWYRAELDSREGLIPSNYIEMKSHEYVIIVYVYVLETEKLNNYCPVRHIISHVKLFSVSLFS